MSLVYLEKTNLKNIFIEKNFKKLKKDLFKKKKIVVFENMYEKFVDELISFSKKKFKKKAKYKRPNLLCDDIIIYNKNFKKSKVRGHYKKLLLFPWNKKNQKFFKQLHLLFKLKNKFELENLKNYFNKSKTMVIQIMYYPKKLGFLSMHTDSKSHKDCIIQINSQQKNSPQNNGGLNLKNNKKNYNLDKVTSKGDVIIFSKGLKHLVEKDEAGSRWSIIISSINF